MLLYCPSILECTRSRVLQGARAQVGAAKIPGFDRIPCAALVSILRHALPRRDRRAFVASPLLRPVENARARPFAAAGPPR